LHGRIERVEHRHHGPLAGVGQPVDLEGPPEHRGDVEDLPGRAGEERATAVQEGPHPLGGPIPSLAEPAELGHEERVAPGSPTDVPGVRLGDGCSPEVHEALHDLVLREASERDAADTTEPSELGDCVGDVDRRFRVSIGAEDEQRGAKAGQADRLEDRKAREVGPLQVVDDDDDRLRSRGPRERVGDLLDESEL
jgi:hypothetical protein